MGENFLASLTISAIAILVIFLVLSILILSIQILVRLIPYKEPPPSDRVRPAPVGEEELEADTAIITAVMASYLGKSPNEFRISNITPK